MLSHEQNLRLTETGPGTACGAVLRQFWQPAALTEELTEERPVKAVRLLGEDLVLFRDDQGRYGLIDRHCPHRGVDLAYGRPEDGGLRCPFHGWLFDVSGACLEQPAEPAGSRFFAKVRTKSYRCRERNGIVFAWLGEGEPPALPDYDSFAAPDSHSFAFKGYLECNWLQALEVGIDPAHASFLHRYFEDEAETSYGLQFRDFTDGADIPVTQLLREFPNPRIEVDQTDYGLRIFALRALNDSHMHVRVTNLAFPNAIVIPMSKEMIITQWHVPIDDRSCWWYAVFSSFGAPVDKAAMREQRLKLYSLPDYRPRIGKHNNYGFDPVEQRTRTYLGMGDDINVHDQWAVESPGPLQDRTKEHLATSDRAITANRRLLQLAMDALEKGTTMPVGGGNGGTGDNSGYRGPTAVDTIGAADDWRSVWQDYDASRRRHCDWAARD